MLSYLGWHPPPSWTDPPPRLDWPDPPLARTDLTPPLDWPDPPHLDWPDPPPPGLTWPPPAGLTPPPCGQTNKVKLLPSRRTTYAGGNKRSICCSLLKHTSICGYLFPLWCLYFVFLGFSWCWLILLSGKHLKTITFLVFMMLSSAIKSIKWVISTKADRTRGITSTASSFICRVCGNIFTNGLRIKTGPCYSSLLCFVPFSLVSNIRHPSNWTWLVITLSHTGNYDPSFANWFRNELLIDLLQRIKLYWTTLQWLSSQ